MTDREDMYALWSPLVRKVATYVSRDFPEVDMEDLAQDLYVFLLAHPEKHPDDVYAEKELRAEAKKIAWSYKKEKTYVNPEFAFKTNDVMKALELHFSHGRDGLPPGLQYAYDRVGGTFQRHIHDRFAKGIFPESDAERQRLYRAIVRLTDLLNMYRPREDHQGPGGRRVINNATARARLELQ